MDKIKEFWRNKVLTEKDKNVSWGDMLMDKEIKVISRNIKDRDKILDIGCANGYSSVGFIKGKNVSLIGIDYVPEMIEQANKIKTDNIEFKVGNATELEFDDKSFDKVNITRCLCNIMSFDEQGKVITEAWRVLKTNGVLLVLEPTIQGFNNLNRIGKIFKLTDLKMPWHNLYLDEEKFVKFVEPLFNIELHNFSSTYYLFSRILYRWFKGDKVKRNSLMNKLGLILPSVGNWGIQKFYVLTKKC